MKSDLKVHYFQHIAGEGFGSCFAYLRELGAQITATEFFALPTDQSLEIEALPQIDDVDLLIIMGGTMSVNDEANYPWLKMEKRWIRRYLAAGKPAIGLCLGAQLIANALGAAVSRNVYHELGWSNVYPVPSVPDWCFQLPAQMRVLQWHRETFEIPKGAILLAENQACRHQMYQIGKNVLGFQFHPESTPDNLMLFLDQDEGWVNLSGPYVQDELSLRMLKKRDFEAGNQLLNRAIHYVLGCSWS